MPRENEQSLVQDGSIYGDTIYRTMIFLDTDQLTLLMYPDQGENA